MTCYTPTNIARKKIYCVMTTPHKTYPQHHTDTPDIPTTGGAQVCVSDNHKPKTKREVVTFDHYCH